MGVYHLMCSVKPTVKLALVNDFLVILFKIYKLTLICAYTNVFPSLIRRKISTRMCSQLGICEYCKKQSGHFLEVECA